MREKTARGELHGSSSSVWPPDVCLQLSGEGVGADWVPALGLTGFRSVVWEEHFQNWQDWKENCSCQGESESISISYSFSYTLGLHHSTVGKGVQIWRWSKVGTIKWTLVRQQLGSGCITERRWLHCDPTFLYAMIIRLKGGAHSNYPTPKIGTFPHCYIDLHVSN